jgi:hypothetical protein
MSASTQPGSSTTSPTVAEINNSVASELSTADTTATQAVQLLSNVNNARLAQKTRAAASITARFGAGSSQAVAAEAAVTATKATVARVAILNQQVSVAAPQVSATGWALYGHVYNAQLQPVSAYTVFLVDAKNAYQGDYGFTYTDSTGYFLISFPGDPASSQSETGSSSPRRRRSQAEAGRTHPGEEDQQSEPAQPATQTSSPLFVEIANANAQPVYLSKTAFQPTLGAATYQNITLPAGEAPIGDPPPAIRQIALPPAGRNA